MKIKIIERYMWYPAILAAWFLMAMSVTSCSDNDPDPVFTPGTELGITEFAVPEVIKIVIEEPVVNLAGKGFTENDKIVFKAVSDNKEYSGINLKSYEDYSEFEFPYNKELNELSFKVYAERAGIRQWLGDTRVSYRISPVVPEREGYNIRGVISCGIERVPGVIVSDGYEFTQTDEEGYYYLASDKVHGYVFFIIPSGYFPDCDGAHPQFWRTLDSQDTSVNETQNFHLNEVDNTEHTMIYTADLHLANRSGNNDLRNYADFLITDLNKFVPQISDQPVYSICLGDMSWDTYWLSEGWDISDYIELARNYPVPLFHVMGNHDNDPKEEGDFNTAKKYKLYAGPTYYSFNIGGVHYVVLDNIVYNKKTSEDENEGQAETEYWRNVTQEQYNWLVKDLSYVTDPATPIMVCMHSQTYTVTGVSENGTITTGSHYNGTTGVGAILLASAFRNFNKVTYLSGHAHINRPVPRGSVPLYSNIQELNMGAACGTWWWTAVYNPYIYCADGSPGGYTVIENRGQDFEWYYKSFGHTRDYQFRVMDMNTVKAFYANSEEGQAYLNASASNIGTHFNASWADPNGILVNVFNWDTNWTLKMEEMIDGEWQDLPFIHKRTKDPLHNLAYDISRYIANGSITTGFATQDTNHMIYAVASYGDNKVRMTATDPFGVVYQEVVDRPKAFHINMY